MAPFANDDELNDDRTLLSDKEVDDTDSDGWDDIEEDEVTESFISLFDDQKFDSITAMFDHCRTKHNFDVWKIQRQRDLDFLGLVKLVNYVRKSVKNGHIPSDLSSQSAFEDDIYLLPVLENDAALYNLEDILVQARADGKTQVEELEEQVASLQSKFDAYRTDVAKYLGDKFENVGDDSQPGHSIQRLLNDHDRQIDADYFHSYSFNSIHETMLKDRVRTDAYRDFVYENKDLFRDKVILDVGCGTGILSIFCARAGAKQVIAVDNSEIINTAREIIKLNNLDDKITCVRGKIEEVQLPVEKVDIIISEWMGYCLLYESMLDSVLYARDRYLATDGLMIPSHGTVRLGAVADSELRQTHLEFWNNVYGIDMSPMVARTSGECLIRVLDEDEMTGNPTTLRSFDLHKVKVTELDFNSTFSIKTAESAERLDGFVLWFDIIFARSSKAEIDDFEIESAKKRGMTAFSTSPLHEPTHWQQVMCLIENHSQGSPLKGKTVEGTVAFKKSIKDSRALQIAVSWKAEDTPSQSQFWYVH